MWVTSGSYIGHIQIVLWVSGSNGSTGATHFQPCLISVAVINILSVTTIVTAISDTCQCTLDVFEIPVLCVHQLPSLKYSKEFLFDYQVEQRPQFFA